MSEEDERGRRAFYGQRLGAVKVARYPDRKPRRGERFRWHNEDGSLAYPRQDEKNDDEREDEKMQMTQQEREAKLKQIEATAEKFRLEHPAEAARAEQEQATWAAEQAEKSFPFEMAVAKLRAGGASLSDAIRKVAAENPALHDDFLERAKTGQTRQLT